MKYATLLLMALLLVDFTSGFLDSKFFMGQDLMLNKSSSDNMYVYGNNVQLLDSINGDLLIIGNNIFVKKHVFDDLTVIGKNIQISGDIGGDVRIIGGEVNLNSSVFGDLVVVGGELNTGKDVIVGKDLVVRSGKIVVDGEIKGDLDVKGAVVIINGVIDGNAWIDAYSLTLGEHAQINGDLITSTNPYHVIDEKQVLGKIYVNESSFEDESVQKLSFGSWFALGLFILIGGLLMTLIMPKFTDKASSNVIGKPISTFLIGLVVLIVIPMFIFLLISTLIGLPLAVLLLLLFLVLIVLGFLLGAIMLGRVLYYVFGGDYPKWAGIFVGGVTFIILMLIPILGFFVTTYFTFTGIGGIIRAPWQRNSFRQKRKKRK